MNSLAGQENVLCLDVHPDLHKCTREQEWHGNVVNVRVQIGAG